jgi:hypothetical protein
VNAKSKMNNILDSSSDEKFIKVARLDGYLNGILVFSGNINEYYAGALLIDNVNNKGVINVIKDYFSNSCEITFINIIDSEMSLRKLESDIQNLIVNNVLGNGDSWISSKVVLDRKKYISFKIMDMVDSLICESGGVYDYNKELCSYKIEVKFADTSANFILFCISLDNYVLVLQFMSPHDQHDKAQQ